MEHFKTLKDVCNELKISRRIVQGYEAKKLIKPVSKNKYGHLLYDDETVKRIAFIRFSQETGLSLDDICSFIDGSFEDTKERLYKQTSHLRSEKERIDLLLNQLERLNNLNSRAEYLNEVLTIIKGGKENI